MRHCLSNKCAPFTLRRFRAKRLNLEKIPKNLRHKWACHCPLWGVAFALLFSNLWATQPVTVESAGALLIEIHTERVLFDRRGASSFYPASTTKIATALLALEKNPHTPLSTKVEAHKRWLGSISSEKKLAQRYRVPQFWLEQKSSHVGIKPKEIVTLGDLYFGTLVASGNDAANLLAAHTCGTIELFMLELNRYLRAIGCKSTQFLNPHGLFHPHHYTTPKDLACIALRAMRHSLFREIVSTRSYLKPATNLQPAVLWRQTNWLLRKGKYHYQRAIGIKTGYTSLSKHCLVAAAKDKERELLVVLMGGTSRQSIYRDAIALFEFGFGQPCEHIVLPQGALPLPQSREIPPPVELAEPLVFRGDASRLKEAVVAIRWRRPLSHYQRGDVLADFDLIDGDGALISTQSLTALNESPSKIERALANTRFPLGYSMCIGGAMIGAFWWLVQTLKSKKRFD